MQHRVRPLRQPPQALFGNLQKLFSRQEEPQQANEQQEAVQRLLDAMEGAERGLAGTAVQRDAVLAAAAELASLGASQTTTTAADLSGTWRLLWTTEKETLFILKRAGWFRTQAGESYQVSAVLTGMSIH